MQYRPYGAGGRELSVVGFGAIVVMNETPEDASTRVAWAIDQGVNYFDVAPSYGDAEIRLGPALEPYRKDVFLACKTAERSAEKARAELEQSLKNLRTDHVDLYQLHALTTTDDIEQAFGPGGAMEVFVRAREEGKTRYLGFSAHSEDAALEALRRFSFDSVLFPLNFASWINNGFGKRLVKTAQEQGVSLLALKAMARGPWPEGVERRWSKPWYEPLDEPELGPLALRWTLELPITAALPPGEWPLFRTAVETAQALTPLDETETGQLESLAAIQKALF